MLLLEIIFMYPIVSELRVRTPMLANTDPTMGLNETGTCDECRLCGIYANGWNGSTAASQDLITRTAGYGHKQTLAQTSCRSTLASGFHLKTVFLKI